jgi:hypothetical protein
LRQNRTPHNPTRAAPDPAIPWTAEICWSGLILIPAERRSVPAGSPDVLLTQPVSPITLGLTQYRHFATIGRRSVWRETPC